MAIVDLASVKSMTNLQGTTIDPWLTALCVGADAAIKRFCKQPLETDNYASYSPGCDTPNLALDYRPILFYICTGDIVAGSPTITNIAPSTPPTLPTVTTAKFIAGMPVAAQGLPTGVKVSPIPVQSNISSIGSTTSVTMNNNATATVTGMPLVFGIDVYADFRAFGGQAYQGVGQKPYAQPTQLFIGINYMVKNDQPDGSSKSGIIQKLTAGPGNAGFWPGYGGSGEGWGRGSLTATLLPTWWSWYGQLAIYFTAGWGKDSPFNGKTPPGTLPADLSMAGVTLVDWLKVNIRPGRELASESMAGYAYSVLSGSKDPAIGSLRGCLRYYRDVAFGSAS